jgi:hypothetical protein
MKGLAIVLALLPVLLPAETTQQRGKRVIDEAVAALGGRNFLEMRDRTETGRAYSFYRERLTGLAIAHIYTRYLTPAPGTLAVRERQAFGKDQSDVILFTDGNGYELTFRGARPLPDTRVAQYRDSMMRNTFYILHARLGEPGMVFDSRGSEVWENQPVEIVDIVDADNRTVTVYFNRSTKLPVYQTFRRRNAVDKQIDDEVTRFSKYRDVGGVMWPFAIQRERNGEKIFEMYSESVVIDKDLKDDLFTLPVNMKILKKEK